VSGALKAAKMGVRGGGQPGRGDPGLFGGIAGLFRGAGEAILTGGNPITGAISGARTGFKRGGRTVVARGGPGVPQIGPISLPSPQSFPVVPTPGVIGAIERFLPGGRTGMEVGPVGGVAVIPKGFRLNKSDYFLRDGTFIAKGTRIVKMRRRDPLNPRALRRAIGRVDAGKIWQGKLSEITTAKFTAGGKRKD